MASVSTHTRRGFAWLISELDARTGAVDEPTVRRLLTQATFSAAEIAPYVEQRAGTYARRCVVRRDHYELLVLTWMPSQGSVAHDHSGSLCGLKVVQGCLTENCFDCGPDGQVRKSIETRLTVDGVMVDPGVVVHSLANDAAASEVLVTVHVYAPPLPEVRRYAVTDKPPAKVFTRTPAPGARVIAIIGGGFTGTMALANLLRAGANAPTPLHLVLIDRQPAIGEGIAYRTNDARHLLNVPASRMSAWPDRPDDFLDYARSKDPTVKPGDFLPRKVYGQYIRDRLLGLAETTSEGISVEVIRDEATRLAPATSSAWTIETAGGRSLRADLAVVAVGHRPPDDPCGKRWTGPRNRFIADPWAALVLSQIGPDEPVLLLGSGLTAADAILTLNRADRTAPVLVISRRGLLPLPHALQSKPAPDLSELVTRWLNPANRLTIRTLVCDLRHEVAKARQTGTDWRQVIDALRPAISQLWNRLDLTERSRFLTHVRPFWEIHRHRMSPDILDTINRLRGEKKLELAAGTLLCAKADADGIDVTISRRNGGSPRNLRVSWIINCTGPGVQNRHSTHPLLRPLLESGTLCDDELSLGLRTDSIGRAIDAQGKTHQTLLVAGTLRKSTLWESTAVPELRQQAQTVAAAALATLMSNQQLARL